MVHRRLFYIFSLNVPSFSSRYFNKKKLKSRLGRLLALSLEILYTFIHQVTKEVQKSLTQENFKSNFEFRYQIIVSSIKFRTCSAKFMIRIALFKNVLSLQFILSLYFTCETAYHVNFMQPMLVSYSSC